MDDSAINLLVFLQLKDKDFSSSSLPEIINYYKKTYEDTKQYLDSNESNKWLY
ncbi:MAG: hypothetical protein K2N80_05290 [Lachnospiraceae bacterium]|nr:hypothetical protein [Lachnospiraceae bacterium]